jgi:hypothetical protein
MSVEEAIIPLEAERKLSYLLRHHKELQLKILAWAKDLLTEARKDWADMRENSVNELCRMERKDEAIKRGKARDKRYAPFREYYKAIQKQKYIEQHLSGKPFSPNNFALWFLENNPDNVAIPYKLTNRLHKLIQLAQENNRKLMNL